MTASPTPVPDVLVFTSSEAAATRTLGRALAEAALPLIAERGLLVALHGDLGAGKTVFVKGVGEGLGLPADAVVVSPTFTIARSLPFAGPPPGELHHVDAYRLRGPEDLDHVGFEEMWGSGTFTCVEWAERVAEALPEDRISVWIEPLEDATVRRLRLAACGPHAGAVLATLAEVVPDLRRPETA